MKEVVKILLTPLKIAHIFIVCMIAVGGATAAYFNYKNAVASEISDLEIKVEREFVRKSTIEIMESDIGEIKAGMGRIEGILEAQALKK